MSLEQIITAYENKYREDGGPPLVQGGDEFDDPKRLWPGSLEMAWAMGGGFPVGRWGRLWGPRSSGKTKTAYSIAASAQKDYGMNVGYINAENQFFPQFAEAQGVDVSKDKFMVLGSKVIEEIAEFIEASMPYIDLFIIDSTSACIAAASKEAGIDSERPMMDAKAWTKVTQFMNDAHDPLRNTVIFIDQARVGKMGNGMFGGTQASGGYALDHYSTLTAKFSVGKWLNSENGFLTDKDAPVKTVSGMKEPAGCEMTVRIEKSRVGPPFRTARLWFDYATGDYESEYEYMKWGIILGMIDVAGSWYSLNGDKVQGGPKLKAAIRQDKDFQAEVKKKVLEGA